MSASGGGGGGNGSQEEEKKPSDHINLKVKGQVWILSIFFSNLELFVSSEIQIAFFFYYWFVCFSDFCDFMQLQGWRIDYNEIRILSFVYLYTSIIIQISIDGFLFFNQWAGVT